MATGMNKVFLMGNLGADPELRQFPTGDKLALRVATTERYRDKNDTLQEITHWHNVALWGPLAAPLGRILAKGDRVVIEGRLESHSYEDSQGNDRVYVEVKARDLHLAGGPRRVPTQPPPLPTRAPDSITMVTARPRSGVQIEAAL